MTPRRSAPFWPWERVTPLSTWRSGGWGRFSSSGGRCSFRLMESVFIALLCYHDTGLSSPFRWYYLLSLDLLLDPLSTGGGLVDARLSQPEPVVSGSRPGRRVAHRRRRCRSTLTIMVWVTWASSSLAGSLHAAGEELERLNAELAAAQTDLERRVEERTDALRASQARVIHQEKMAAFGLLAAGIAHEVGNPLAALSSLVQILKRRGPDPYTAEKLDLAGAPVAADRAHHPRADRLLPAGIHGRDQVSDRRGRRRSPGDRQVLPAHQAASITTDVPADLPTIRGVRDYLTQVVLNLVLERDRRDRRPGADPRGRPRTRRSARPCGR